MDSKDKKQFGIEARMQGGLRLDLNLPWEEVLDKAKRYTYAKRSRLVLPGELEGDFYYISKGKVCLQVPSLDGKERMTNYFGKGSIFNLAAVFYPNLGDAGSWVFLEDSVIWRFSGQILHDEEFVRAYPHLIINLLDSQSFSLLTQYTWLTDMYLADPVSRVARYLTGLAVAAGDLDSFVSVTQQDAALQLGMHRGTLSAVLKQLKEEGIVGEFSRGHLHILDIDRLQALGHRQFPVFNRRS